MIYKKTLFQLSHFFLACLICMMNVNGNNFFHAKELLFVLFLFTSLQYADFKKVFNFLLMMVIYLYSMIVNLFMEANYPFNTAIYFILGFVYLFLQVYETPQYTKTIIKTFIISAIVVAFMSIIIWIICMISPIAALGLSIFFETDENDAAAFIFMIQNRTILGFEFMRVYYCTAPCLICALGYYLQDQFTVQKKKNKFFILLFSFGLLISGARANLLAVILLNGSYICCKLIKEKKLVAAFFIISVGAFAALFFLMLMLSEKSDDSIKVKALHKLSYMKVFSEHPYKTIFSGWGPGSEFYSRGFGRITNTTELSFYETIRRYGILSTILIFIFIWGRPIIYCFSNKMPVAYQIFFSITVACYVFVACTNPFLLGSIGFCSLIFMETLIADFYHNKNPYRNSLKHRTKND